MSETDPYENDPPKQVNISKQRKVDHKDLVILLYNSVVT